MAVASSSGFTIRMGLNDMMMVETRQLLYVGCATQQQPTSAGTRSDPSRRAGSRVARVQWARHTRTRLLHVLNTSFTRLNVSRHTLSTWTVAQPPQQSRTVQAPDSSLPHHYAPITRYFCNTSLPLRFYYVSYTRHCFYNPRCLTIACKLRPQS